MLLLLFHLKFLCVFVRSGEGSSEEIQVNRRWGR